MGFLFQSEIKLVEFPNDSQQKKRFSNLILTTLSKQLFLNLNPSIHDKLFVSYKLDSNWQKNWEKNIYILYARLAQW